MKENKQNNKLFEAIKEVLLNFFLIVIAWRGINGSEGLGNLLIFLTWFLAVLFSIKAVLLISCKILSEKKITNKRERKPVVPNWITDTFHFGLIILLVWHAWWWTAVAVVIFSLTKYISFEFDDES